MRARLQPLLLSLLLLAAAAGPARAISGNQPGVFAFGGIGFSGATSPGELKFREIMTSDDPETGFRTWFRDGGNVGKAYALVALYYLDPERYEMNKARFADQHLQVPTMEGCSVGTLNYEQLTENIEAGRYDRTVKRFLPEHVREEHFPAPAEGAFALHPANKSAAQIELSTDETTFRQILASDDPIDGLSIWATGGSPVQRAYGLLGLYYLAPELYQPLKARYADDTTTFIVFTDGKSSPVNTGDFIALIETDRYQQDLAPLLARTASSEKTAPINLFAFGLIGAPPGEISEGEKRFREIYASPSAVANFTQWADSGTPAERAYALVGLYYRAPDRYQTLKARYEDDDTPFTEMLGCLSRSFTYKYVIKGLETGRYDHHVRLDPAPQGDKATLFATPNCCPAPADASAAQADAPSSSGCACPSCACSDCSCGDGKTAAPVPAP